MNSKRVDLTKQQKYQRLLQYQLIRCVICQGVREKTNQRISKSQVKWGYYCDNCDEFWTNKQIYDEYF